MYPGGDWNYWIDLSQEIAEFCIEEREGCAVTTKTDVGASVHVDPRRLIAAGQPRMLEDI